MRYRIARDDADGHFYVEWFGKGGFLGFLREPRWHRVTGQYRDWTYDQSFSTEADARAFIIERAFRANSGVTIVAEIETP